MDVIKGQDHWHKLWWIMSRGDKTQYDSYKKTEVVEFFSLMKKFNADIERENQKHQKK